MAQKTAKDRSVVGDLINFRGLVYSPVNEQGVVYLFSKVAEDLNMYVEEIKQSHPDCFARRFNGKGWERIAIEFEYQSKNFVDHKHDVASTDVIVCWEHNWPECPVEVLELRGIVKGLPNWEIGRPDAQAHGSGTSVGNDGANPNPLDVVGASHEVRTLYGQLESELLALGQDVWHKIAPRDFTFYSPKRVFIYARPLKSGLRLTLFTRGQLIEGIKPVGYEHGGHKWGRVVIHPGGLTEEIVNACRLSYTRMLDALNANELTGWYAGTEPTDDEDDGTDS